MLHAWPDWPRLTDLEVYLDAGDAIAKGQSPYNFRDETARDPYSYPPLFAGVVGLLTVVLGHGKLWMLWSAFGVACLTGSMVLMLRRFGPVAGYQWVLIAIGVVLMSRVARADIVHGQINFLILLLLVFGLRQFLLGRPAAGSAAWAIIIVCKPFLGIIVLYLLLRKQWIPAALVVGLAAVLFGASFLPFGANAPTVFWDWLESSHWRTSLPIVAQGDNQSLYGMFMRMMTESYFSSPWFNLPSLVPWIMVPFVATASILTLCAVPRSPIPDNAIASGEGPISLVHIGILLGFALSCGPLMEGSHIFLVIPGLVGVAMMARRRLSAGAPSSDLWVVITGVWCLALITLAVPPALALFQPHTWGKQSGVYILASGRLGISLYVATLLTALTLWRERYLVTAGQGLASQLLARH
jgi:hypothetical protein